MNIRQADKTDRPKWDDYVNNHKESTPYHLSAWTHAIQNAYGFKSYNLVAEENGLISGVFPLTKIKTPFRGADLVALPYCDVGTILANSPNSQKKLLEAALTICKDSNISTIDIRGKIDNESLQSIAVPFQTNNNKVRMLLNLPATSEDLLSSFKSKLRSQIRKAKKNGLAFQFANENIDDFYSVFSLNMRDLGSPVHSKKWFKEIIKQFADNAKMGLVYHEEKAIGAGIILKVGNKISIPWASTLREYNRLGPNMLLYWHFLKYAADHNCRTFDFGRSTPQEGTYKFKKQWGAEPIPLPWHKLFLKGVPAQETSESSKSREFIASIWQKFPLNLANFLGPKIRKHISL